MKLILKTEISDWRPKTKNQTSGPKGFWHVQNDKKTVHQHVWADANQQKTSKAGQPRHVDVELHKKHWKEQDPDNLHHNMKSILDALVREGLLVDDSRQWVTYEIAEVTRSDRNATIIRVFEND